jgi:hypothetical protein
MSVIVTAASPDSRHVGPLLHARSRDPVTVSNHSVTQKLPSIQSRMNYSIFIG